MDFKMPDPLASGLQDFCDELPKHLSQHDPSVSPSLGETESLLDSMQKRGSLTSSSASSAKKERAPLGELDCEPATKENSRMLASMKSLRKAAHTPLDVYLDENNLSNSEDSFQGDLADISNVSFGDETDIIMESSAGASVLAKRDIADLEGSILTPVLEKDEVEVLEASGPISESIQQPTVPAKWYQQLSFSASNLHSLLKWSLFFLVFNTLIRQTSKDDVLHTSPPEIQIIRPSPLPTSDRLHLPAPLLQDALQLVREQIEPDLTKRLSLPTSLLFILGLPILFLIYKLVFKSLCWTIMLLLGTGSSSQKQRHIKEIRRSSHLDSRRRASTESRREVEYQAFIMGGKSVGVKSLYHRLVTRIVENASSTPIELTVQRFNKNNLSMALHWRRAVRQVRNGTTWFTTPLTGKDKLAFLVFDLTDEASFECIKNTIERIKQRSDDRQCYLFLIGNKSDLTAGSNNFGKRVAQYAKNLNILYEEVSALTGENVDDAFRTFVRHVRADDPRCQEA